MSNITMKVYDGQAIASDQKFSFMDNNGSVIMRVEGNTLHFPSASSVEVSYQPTKTLRVNDVELLDGKLAIDSVEILGGILSFNIKFKNE
jgi:glutamine cyclotransferase